MLDMKNVRKVYRTELIETHALEDFSLHVEAGEFVAIMGPSGSGKTTFLNVAGLLDTFDSGTYLLDGKNVSHLSDSEMSRIRNQNIGFVFQSFNLLGRMSALENVELPLIYRSIPAAERHARALEVLAALGLEGWEKHTPVELSGGQQQRVAIARAIVTNPAVLLADEPTGNLDSAHSREIMELLTQLNRDRGLTIVMVTHEPDMAAYAQRCVHFLDGAIAVDELQEAIA
jgi:putative ABC transport system ATP-binding protein